MNHDARPGPGKNIVELDHDEKATLLRWEAWKTDVLEKQNAVLSNLIMTSCKKRSRIRLSIDLLNWDIIGCKIADDAMLYTLMHTECLKHFDNTPESSLRE